MPYPKFDELPFNSRPDLTPYLIHLAKNTIANDKFSAYQNLISILMSGEIFGSGNEAFIKGKREAACFMDVPFSSLKYVLTPENSNPGNPRYEPYGIAVTKLQAYSEGCRPVLYLSRDEQRLLSIPADELWRVVIFEVDKKGWRSWLHEREWRSPEKFQLPVEVDAVFVKDADEAAKLTKSIHKKPEQFKCRPKSVIPLEVVCQGLMKGA